MSADAGSDPKKTALAAAAEPVLHHLQGRAEPADLVVAGLLGERVVLRRHLGARVPQLLLELELERVELGGQEALEAGGGHRAVAAGDLCGHRGTAAALPVGHEESPISCRPRGPAGSPCGRATP